MHRSGRDKVQEALTAIRQQLTETLVDREEEIDLVLTALLSREHVLLVGPPGCGKSLLLDSLMAWVGGRKFAALLTRFSVPEELFGPVSLAALKDDRFIRVTTGKLPEAEFVFLDEVFRGNSAILNSLLKILNERVFDAGDGVNRPTPLHLCMAASNEWPAPETAKELSAMFDRFLLRKAVTPIRTREGRQRLLWNGTPRTPVENRIAPETLREATDGVATTTWSVEAKEAFEAVLRELSKEGVQPGDRRQVKTVRVVQAYAFLQGATVVQPEHLEIAAHCLWDDPLGHAKVAASVIARIANPPGMRVNQMLLEAEEILSDADPRDLAKAATAAAKLGEVERRLAEIGAEPRAAKVRTYVREQIRKLRLASLSAV